MSDAEQVPHRLAPELGKHTDEMLRELGYDADAISALHTSGAVR